MANGRQYAIKVEGTVVTFECQREGHTYSIDFGKRPLAQRLGEQACRMMARWWSRERGGSIGECPHCRLSKGVKLGTAAGDAPCTACKAASGSPCNDSPPRVGKYHQARIDAAAKLTRDANRKHRR